MINYVVSVTFLVLYVLSIAAKLILNDTKLLIIRTKLVTDES